MDSSLILWVALALCVCWGVGVYNRLMRMRARGLRALSSVEKHMRLSANHVRDDVALGAAIPSHKTDVGHSPEDWAQLLSALQEFEAALKDMGAGAQKVEPLVRLGQAFDAVQAAWRTVDDAPHDLAGPAVPPAMRAQWDLTTHRVETARGGYNQIATQYNEALDQFPARLVAGMMGFKPSGMI